MAPPAGAAPSADFQRVNWDAVQDALAPPLPAVPVSGELQGVTLRLDGLWCPSCATLVAHVLSRRPGVLRARVDFAAGTAEAIYDPATTDPDNLCRVLARLGYRASRGGAEDAAIPDILRRLALAVPAAVLVMMGSVVVWSGDLNLLPAGLRVALVAGLWSVATPVVFWSGWPFLRGAWTSVRHGRPSMDVLVALGSLAAYAYSVAAALSGGSRLYFDTACMIVTFLLLGRALELGTRDRAAGVMRLLADVAADRAIVLRDGAEQEVAASDVRVADLCIVRPGQRLPADGTVVEGGGAFDESALSGEPAPVDKRPGMLVYAGAISVDSRVVVRAERVGTATALGAAAAAVRAAQGRGRLQQLADRLVRVFVPAVLLLGVAALVFWSGPGAIGASAALWRAIAVLVIACPCALAIATPLAVLAGSRSLGRDGVLLRAGDALERAAGVDVVLVDKTGTLTDGRLQLIARHPADDALLAVAAAVETGSRHPLAMAVVRAAEERGLILPTVQGFSEQPGIGVRAQVDGHEVQVGRPPEGRAWDDTWPPMLEAWERNGWTALLIRVDGTVRGALALSDAPRAEAAEVVGALGRLGVEVRLVTGDAEGPAAVVARAVGIARWDARQLPAAKAGLVAALQAEGRRVAFVGDGVNDAAALVQADVGLALASGADIALQAGRVTLVRADLRGVPRTLVVGRRTFRIIRQNLAWALGYNLLAVPAAWFGLAGPVVAAAAMAASSLFVLGNALRLLGWRPQRLVAGVLGGIGFATGLAWLAWRGW